MAETETKIPLEKIDSAINMAIHYLSQHQLPNGEFISYMAPDEAMQDPSCSYQGITYTTALIGHCLLPHQNRPEVDTILKKLTAFLQYQSMRGGVWNFFTKYHPFFKFLPPDTDDTAIIAALLKKRNVDFPDNIPLFLCNRASNGAFYTWFTIHNTFWKYSQTYWKLVLREFKHPVKSLLFWSKHEHSRNDIDIIPNVNVLAYLGHSKITEPALNYIVDTLKQNKEINSDKWYANPIVYYYFIARLASTGIAPVTNLKGLLIEKVNTAIAKKSNFLNCHMEIALATSSLLMLNYYDSNIELYINKLIQSQKTTGEWNRYGFYTGGPKLLVFGGCEELTTALGIEALHLYREYLNKKQSGCSDIK